MAMDNVSLVGSTWDNVNGHGSCVPGGLYLGQCQWLWIMWPWWALPGTMSMAMDHVSLVGSTWDNVNGHGSCVPGGLYLGQCQWPWIMCPWWALPGTMSMAMDHVSLVGSTWDNVNGHGSCVPGGLYLGQCQWPWIMCPWWPLPGTMLTAIIMCRHHLLIHRNIPQHCSMRKRIQGLLHTTSVSLSPIQQLTGMCWSSWFPLLTLQGLQGKMWLHPAHSQDGVLWQCEISVK